MRPGFERFRSNTTTAGFRLTFRPPVEQGYTRAALRESLRSERTRRPGAHNQNIKIFATHLFLNSRTLWVHISSLPIRSAIHGKIRPLPDSKSFDRTLSFALRRKLTVRFRTVVSGWL